MAEVDPGTVSFYIPAHNAGRTLAAAIESVRAQTVQPAEFFLVVDRRSTDETVEIARASGVPIVEQHQRRLGHARNLAIQRCRTRWLASCDADVALEPTWLERLLARCGDDVAAVGGCTFERLITPADRWRSVNMPHNWGPQGFDNPFMLVSEMIADVRALRRVGGYLEHLRYFEDSDLCQRLRHAGFTLRYEPGAVAYHDRRDTVRSVLDLRWRYAAHRQRTRLENLPGLRSKLAINRTYCLQSLSQTWHSPQADTCAISLLLWFHHARMDLAAALEPWELLTPAARATCLQRLNETLLECLAGDWKPLCRPLTSLLEPLPACEREDDALADLPGFRDYLHAVRRATTGLLSELPEPVRETLIASAQRLAGHETNGPLEPPRLTISDADRLRLVHQPRRPAWNWHELAETLSACLPEWSPESPISIVGPQEPAERPDQAGTEHAGDLVLLPHLETFADPRGALHAALGRASWAVVAYQAPEIFVPAVPILTARDLAAECTAAGFEIRHFYTEAGRTRLVVSRSEAGLEGGLLEAAAAATSHIH